MQLGTITRLLIELLGYRNNLKSFINLCATSTVRLLNAAMQDLVPILLQVLLVDLILLVRSPLVDQS